MEQAADFLAETEALATLLAPLPDEAFEEATQFKSWTLNDVIRHLHFWNRAAGLQLTDEAELLRLLGAIGGAGGMRAVEREVVPLSGQALRSAWIETAGEIAALYRTADPKQRLKWAGPDMSARSSITARLMETWAHGLDCFAALDAPVHDTDRLRHVAWLGWRTLPYAFAVARREPPAPVAELRIELTAPSGATWVYGSENADHEVRGPASVWCRVVTHRWREPSPPPLSADGALAVATLEVAQAYLDM
jgi:uncharacterized protein (TIGR03084 family)